MSKARNDELKEMRGRLSTACDVVLDHCAQLQNEGADWKGLELDADINRIVLAARELNRRVREILKPDNDAYEMFQHDIVAFQNRLRHDLRNPVGVVKGYLEMLVEDIEDAGKGDSPAIVAELMSHIVAMERSIDGVVSFKAADSIESAHPARADAVATAIGDDEDEIEEKVAITGRILVVDDLEANRRLIGDRLRRDGHTVAEAANGTSALRMMQDNDFDLVLLDLMMPGFTGFDVMARMRENRKLRNVGVIVVSAMDQEENAIKSITLGAIDYLAKPVNPILLRARIGASLARNRWREQEQRYRLHLEAEKDKSEALLLNTLPPQVVKRLTSGEKVIADAYDNVTVLFSDFVNFTTFSEAREPQEVVEVLNRIVIEFDDLGLDLGVEKIKTIGDGYLAVAGLPVPRPDHAEIMADMALGMMDILESMNKRLKTDLEMRIGLHSGLVVAGIIGSHKFAYDIWGQTVNLGARHESYSLPQHIHVSSETARLLEPKFNLKSRGTISIRGFGDRETYFLSGRKKSLAAAPVAATKAGKMLKVMIADDDENTRDMMARRIRRRGWQAETAVDGNDAWNKLQNRRFDLLITDCDMPAVDGFELTRRIRHAEEFSGSEMVIVALTGNTSSGAAQECIETGMDAYLRKPVMWAELEKCILRLLFKEMDGADSKPESRPLYARSEQVGNAVILDVAVIEEVYGKIDSKALNALKVLRRSLGESVNELISATQEHDYVRASKAAHAVIGASLTAGANELADCCKQMQEALNARDVTEAGRYAENVAFALERLGDQIDAIHLEHEGDAPVNDDSREQKK